MHNTPEPKKVNVLEDKELEGKATRNVYGDIIGIYAVINVTEKEFDQIDGDTLAWFIDNKFKVFDGVYDYYAIKTPSNRGILIYNDYALEVGTFSADDQLEEPKDGVYWFWIHKVDTYELISETD